MIIMEMSKIHFFNIYSCLITSSEQVTSFRVVYLLNTYEATIQRNLYLLLGLCTEVCITTLKKTDKAEPESTCTEATNACINKAKNNDITRCEGGVEKP